MLLWEKLALECASRCCTSAHADIKTVRMRSEHEGFSFLTITLPDFGKDFQKSLDQGWVDRNLFRAFRGNGRAGLPRFLGGFLDRVFDRSSGVLLDVPCVDAIHSVRQLTLLFSKVLLECSDAREKEAIAQYVKCEMDVRSHDASLSEADLADFRSASSLLFAGLLGRVDYDVFTNQLVPKHGPGSTADGLLGNSKYRLSYWTQRLEAIMPSGEYIIPNWSFLDLFDAVDIHEPGAELPVKVISVPKTLKTPRIIAIEPTAMQFAQQAILSSIVENLPRYDGTRYHNLVGLLGFSDQTPNQRLAREGSLTGSLATLDLSEASDRVSNQLVRAMTAPHPHLHAAVDACRSRKADVPGVGVIRLAKFASMGSALTFPMEAMVFTTLIFIAISRELSTPLDRRLIDSFNGKVRVYGDDLLVPVEFVPSVLRVLSDFGLKVNTHKSYWTGRFRESCGREYYAGEDVSIVRVRNVFPTDRKDATEVISLVSLRNQLYFAGFWQTCQWLDEMIVKCIKHFPVVLPSSQVQGRYSFLGYDSSQGLTPDTHVPCVKGYVVSVVIPPNQLEGAPALLKFFLKRGGLPNADVKHLERSGRPVAVNIKLRNRVPAF